jgi:hypothetical protein
MPVNIPGVNVADGCLDVCSQDQATPTIDALFAQSLSNFAIAVDTGISELTTLVKTFTAVTGHGILIGDEILLLDVVGDREYYAEVLGVAGDVITVDRPIDHIFPATQTPGDPTFPASTSFGRIVNTNMAVDGSVTEQIFSVRSGQVKSDITRYILRMLGTTAMDDGKFGDQPPLTRGIVFRILNSFQKTIFNFKTNGEISQFCFDLRYADKAPAGNTGLSSRTTFAGQDKHGVVLRIGPTTDAIQLVVQDDLTTLIELKIAAQGHKTVGE